MPRIIYFAAYSLFQQLFLRIPLYPIRIQSLNKRNPVRLDSALDFAKMMNRLLLMLSFALMIDQKMPSWMPLHDQSLLWAAAFPALGLATRKLRLQVIRPGLVSILAAALYRAGTPPALQPYLPNGHISSLLLFFGALLAITAVHESKLIRPSFLVVAEVGAVLYLYGTSEPSWVDILLESGGMGDLVPKVKPFILGSSLVMLMVVVEVYSMVDIRAQSKWYVLAGIAIHTALMLQTVITQVRIPQASRLLANMPMLAWFSSIWNEGRERESSASVQ